MQLTGKIALVTGGSRGIGRATALAFAREGADIGFCHLNDDAQAAVTAGEILSHGRRVMHRSVDVADIAAGKKFADDVAAAFGPVEILFNNAGNRPAQFCLGFFGTPLVQRNHFFAADRSRQCVIIVHIDCDSTAATE